MSKEELFYKELDELLIKHQAYLRVFQRQVAGETVVLGFSIKNYSTPEGGYFVLDETEEDDLNYFGESK